MPVFTTLEFFRTKQTVESFEKNYPKSIYGLREAILGSLECIDGMLIELTNYYLAGYHSYESYIRDQVISIHLLLTETNMEGIYKKSDFETIIDRAGSASLNDHINKLKEISSIVSTYNPNSFTPIVEIFEKIISCMEKYFLSFYNGSIHSCPSVYISSSFSYENTKREILHCVKEKLRAIYNLSNRFNTQGITINEMSDNSKQVARRAKCIELPFFLIFYESCEIITESKKMLIQWIEADKEYLKTLKTDLLNFGEEEKELELKRRTDYDECVKRRHMLEKTQQEHNELNVLKPIMLRKLGQCENKIYECLISIKSNEITLEKAEHVIKNLNIRLEKDEKQSEIISAINDQQYIVDKTKKTLKEKKLKLKRFEEKVEWYKSFEKTFSDMTDKLEMMIVQFTKIKRLVEDDEDKIRIIREYLAQLHKIYLLKSSNVTLKKIFHNLELGNRMNYLSPSRRSKENLQTDTLDDLSKAINLTSRFIDKDWISLYGHLPFHPPRGNAEIENDVSKFTRTQVRGLLQDMALQSLKTWRRLHIRANVTCLLQALEKINRFDIIKKIDIVPKESPDMSIRRFQEDKLPPMSATSRFLIKHYPNLHPNHQQTM